MWPSDILTDFDYDEISEEELTGRWALLVDLHSEFQGMALAYGVLAVLFPALLIAGTHFGLGIGDDNPEYAFVAAAVLFLVFGTISVFSWIWYRWVRKRLNRADKLMGLSNGSA